MGMNGRRIDLPDQNVLITYFYTLNLCTWIKIATNFDLPKTKNHLAFC